MKRALPVIITLLILAMLLAASYHYVTEKEAVPEEPKEDPIPSGSIVFSAEAGYYPEGVDLEMSASEGYKIYYTTDGSVPDSDSDLYTGKIALSGSACGWLDESAADKMVIQSIQTLSPAEEIPDAWVIRAVAVSPEGECGTVYTKTFFTAEDPSKGNDGIMVVSLVTDLHNLLDYETGIMCKGRIFDEWYSKKDRTSFLSWPKNYHLIEANYSQSGAEWERPASVELFVFPDNTCIIQQDAGIRIQGNASLAYSKKSLRVNFSSRYGQSRLICDVFGEGIFPYDSLLLRNGGNMTESIPYKDSMQQSLLSHRSFLTQKNRATLLYINGEYWGTYSLDERYTANLLEDKYDLIDALVVKNGSFYDGNELCMYMYDELLSFIDKDLSDPNVWREFCDSVDVINMAEFFAAQIYMANYDFSSSSNNMLWRCVYDDGQKYSDGKWRFMMFDTDFSSGLYNDGRATHNTDTMSLVMKNYPLFRAALRSPAFRELFLCSLKDIGSSELSYESVNSALDKWDSEWSIYMSEDFKRYGDYSKDYRYYLSKVKTFYKKRYDYIVSRVERILNQF